MASRTLKIIMPVVVVIAVAVAITTIMMIGGGEATVRKGTVLKYSVSGPFIMNGTMLIKVIDENTTHFKVYGKMDAMTILGRFTNETTMWTEKNMWSLRLFINQSKKKCTLKQNTTDSIVVMDNEVKAWKTIWDCGKEELTIYLDKHYIPLMIISKQTSGTMKGMSIQMKLVETNTKITPIR